MTPTVMTARVHDQRIQLVNEPLIASGGVNVIQIRFDFCDLWAGCGKTAVFYRTEDEVYHVPISQGVATVPAEVLTDEGHFYFGVMGAASNIRTTEVLRVKVAKGAITEATAEPAEPTPNIYQQIMRDYGVLDARVTELVAMAGGGGSRTVDISEEYLTGWIDYNGSDAHIILTIKGLSLPAGSSYHTDYFIAPEYAPLAQLQLTSSHPNIAVVMYTTDGTPTHLEIINHSDEDYPSDMSMVAEAFYPVRNPYNAELADIRVGADGTTYGSAGDAVRASTNNVVRQGENINMNGKYLNNVKQITLNDIAPESMVAIANNNSKDANGNPVLEFRNVPDSKSIALRGIAPGTEASDAVNKAQLDASITHIASENAEQQAQIDVLNSGGLVLKDEVIGEQVSDWLNAHPEATTTVQDGSLSKEKFTAIAQAEIVNDYATPEMFGAVGDGVTDDTEAVRACIDSKKKVLLVGNYYITGTISLHALTDNGIEIHGGVGSSIVLSSTAEGESVFTITNTVQTTKGIVSKNGNIQFYGVNVEATAGGKQSFIKYVAVGDITRVFELYVENCTTNVTGYAISLEQMGNVRRPVIKDCRFKCAGALIVNPKTPGSSVTAGMVIDNIRLDIIANTMWGPVFDIVGCTASIISNIIVDGSAKTYAEDTTTFGNKGRYAHFLNCGGTKIDVFYAHGVTVGGADDVFTGYDFSFQNNKKATVFFEGASISQCSAKMYVGAEAAGGNNPVILCLRHCRFDVNGFFEHTEQSHIELERSMFSSAAYCMPIKYANENYKLSPNIHTRSVYAAYDRLTDRN